MHATQTTYIHAAAAYDLAVEELGKHSDTLDWDGDFDAACESAEAKRGEVGMDEITRLRDEAQDALFAWARQRLAADCPAQMKANGGAIATLFDAVKTRPAYRAKVVDAALRLAA